MLAAIIAQDTQYGIKALKGLNNLSNIGVFDNLKTKFDDWESSLKRTAQFLSSLLIK